MLLALGAALAAVQRGAAAGSRVLLAAAVLACSGAAALSTGLHQAGLTAGPLPGLASAGATVDVTGVLTDDPRQVNGASRPGGRPLVVITMRADQVRRSGEATRLRAPVLVLSSDPTWLGLLPSQRVETRGRLRPAERGGDVAAVLSGRGPPQVLGPPSAVQRVAGRLRQGLREAVAPLPERERGLLPGLVVGDVSALGEQVRDDFRTVGLTHLTAVSGTNVAVVIGAVLLLGRRCRVPLRLNVGIAMLALAGFVVLARPSPSVLRAAVMGLVALVALASGSRRSAMPALAAAVLMLVLLDPPLAGTAGFALSVLATGGLLVLAPGWRAALRRWLPGWLADAIAVPAAAQVAVGPVVVAISGTLGVLSVPANLLAVPAVAPATVAGVVAALLAPVSLPLAQLVAWIGYLPTAWLVLLASAGSRLPGAALTWPGGAGGALLLAGLSLALLVALRSKAMRRGLVAAVSGTAVAATALGTSAPTWPPPGWVLVACDVGQGDAVVLNAGAGAAVVVDAGPDSTAVDACLRRLGVRSVPLVLLSHLHADHVDGLPGVLRDRSVGAVEIGPLDEPAHQHDDVVAQTAEAGVPLVRSALDERRQVGGLSWQVLAPRRSFRGTSSDPNNSSLVLRVVVGGRTVLLTGDVEPEAQRSLVTAGVDLRADVLKVPHHGSSHQDPAFLEAVGARLVLTSVGAGNTYGHPSSATLGQLTSTGAVSLRTDLDGDIAVVVHDGELSARARGSPRR